MRFQKQGWNKWLAFVRAILFIFRRYPGVTIDFLLKNKMTKKSSPLIFIGNNKYNIFDNIGARDRIDQGSLFVSIAHSKTRLGIIRLAFSLIRGRLLHEKDFDVVGLRTCTITSSRKKVLVSCDGEIHYMKPPLTYSILPKALHVIIP
jgi:diacylglycerol kinase family enzyme